MHDLTNIQDILDRLYDGVNGYNLSFSDRVGDRKEDKNFTYGEMLLEPFARILDAVAPKPGERFYDLGSGTGKVLVMADQLHPFASVTGIEFLPTLNAKATEILARYGAELRGPDRTAAITSRQGDMLVEDLSDADVIFVHATCMSPELIESLGHKLVPVCKPTARIVLVSRGFFGMREYECLERLDYTNAWNTTSTAFVYRLADVVRGVREPVALSA